MHQGIAQIANTPRCVKADLVAILDHKLLWPEGDRAVNDVERGLCGGSL
jgi:hypothetical protein